MGVEESQRDEVRALRERLQAEARLAELARSFLALESEELVAGIEAALETAGLEAGADRVQLIALRPDGSVFAHQQWAREGIPRRPALRWREEGGPRFRWSQTQHQSGKTLHLPSVDSLPPEAAEERAAFRDDGVLSYLAIPLKMPGLAFACLDFSCLRGERSWSEDEIDGLRLVAELFASALRRRLAERERDRAAGELERQLALEIRIVELSRDFLSIAGPDLDAGIQAGLRSTADLVGAERAWLYSIDVANGEFLGRYEWCGEGVASAVERHARPGDSPGTDWFRRQLLTGEVVVVNRLDDLPEEASAAREEMEQRGVRSQLGIPLFAGSDFIGFLGLETFREERQWPETTVPPLRLLGELFAGALRQKRAEEELGESQRLLAHAQRMEAMGQLAGGIAHDFNNLLIVISGCAENLALHLAPAARLDLEEIQGASERAATLTRQLLAFGRRQPVETQVLDPGAVAREIAPMLRRLLGEDVELVIEGDDAPTVRADRHQLEQVLVNLAVNARDAMPAGGQLRIETGSHTLRGSDAELFGVEPGRYAAISVSDDGLGMEEQVRLRVFEPYFTTKAVGRGTGLGLAIVYGIVRQNEGAIRVETAPQKGTTFHVYLPAGQGAESATRPERAAPSAGGHETVLLVEDESAVRRLVRRALEAAGYQVLEACDGQEALECVAAHEERIDLLLSDMVMPRMGGSELARRLAAASPGLPVLLMSGYVDERVAEPTRGLRSARLLEKPFDMATLRAAVREALDEGSD